MAQSEWNHPAPVPHGPGRAQCRTSFPSHAPPCPERGGRAVLGDGRSWSKPAPRWIWLAQGRKGCGLAQGSRSEQVHKQLPGSAPLTLVAVAPRPWHAWELHVDHHVASTRQKPGEQDRGSWEAQLQGNGTSLQGHPGSLFCPQPRGWTRDPRAQQWLMAAQVSGHGAAPRAASGRGKRLS